MFRRIAIVCAALLLAAPLAAQDSPADLARIAAERLDAAEASLASANSARDRVKALTSTIRAYEDGLDALNAGLRISAAREAAILAQFDATSAELSRLLAVLMNLRNASGPVGLMHPDGPLGAARAGMVVSDVTPAIHKRAEELRATLAELAIARSLQESAADQLVRGLTGAQEARAALSRATADRTELPMKFAADPAAMALLRENTTSLEDFASGLISLTPDLLDDAPIRAFADARGTLPLPVHGQLLRSFNEADAAGIRRPGLIVATLPQALVTTPWPATIRYAGPLLDYGQVIIAEPEAGTLLVLAGLGALLVEAGQVLPADAPLGLMGGAAPDPNTFLLNAGKGAGSALTETLYIELRQDEKPVDPTDWFAQTKD